MCVVIVEFGLLYVSDVVVMCYVVVFLNCYVEGLLLDMLLFNGGVFCVGVFVGWFV